jgi:hypothetical protein
MQLQQGSLGMCISMYNCMVISMCISMFIRIVFYISILNPLSICYNIYYNMELQDSLGMYNCMFIPNMLIKTHL